MKEEITIRLYEGVRQGACCELASYYPDESIKGWNYQRGDQIGLRERDGGFLMGRIERVDPDIRVDNTGRYKLALLWTLD